MEKKLLQNKIKNNKRIPLAIAFTILIATTTFFIIDKDGNILTYKTENKSIKNTFTLIQTMINSILQNK